MRPTRHRRFQHFERAYFRIFFNLMHVRTRGKFMNLGKSLAVAVAAAITGVFLPIAIQPAKATVITVTSGDPGEGLTLDPALVVAASNVGGATATLQGVSVPANGSNISFGSIAGGYTGNFQTPPSPTANDQAIATLLNTGGYVIGGSIEISVTGLSPNQLHKVNLLISDIINPGYTRDLAFSFNDGAPVDPFTTLNPGGYNVENLVQSTANGTISVAISSSAFYENGNPGGGNIPIVSTVFVSVVPEPETWAMAGAGIAVAATCGVFRRRRRTNARES
jgi:hypothetical protein